MVVHGGGLAVYVACSSECFRNYSLDRALRTIHELRFAKVDLSIGEESSHLRTSEIVEDVNRVAQALRVTNMSFSAFHLSLSSEDSDANREALRCVSRLGRLLAIPVVSILAASRGSDLSAELKRLAHWNRIAVAEGVILAVTTHCQTVTADPLGTAELCKRIPGLGLTLDPSHYLAGSHPRDDFDLLYPYVRHVRLRDSKGDKLQVRVGQGEIDYSKIITQLERSRYDRALSVDIQPIPDQDFPMEPEVRKLKFLLESML